VPQISLPPQGWQWNFTILHGDALVWEFRKDNLVTSRGEVADGMLICQFRFDFSEAPYPST